MDIEALEARVKDLYRQAREAERELVEARKREVAFRYLVNARAREGEYLRLVLPRGVTLVAAPPGWNVSKTRWSDRVKLCRVVTRDEPREHVFSCAAPKAWVRGHLASTRSSDGGNGDGGTGGATTASIASPPVWVAGGTAAGSS